MQLVTQPHSVNLVELFDLKTAPARVLNDVQTLDDEAGLNVGANQDLDAVRIMGHAHVSHLRTFFIEQTSAYYAALALSRPRISSTFATMRCCSASGGTGYRNRSKFAADRFG